MKDKNKYSAENIQKLAVHEHMRLRPAMYLGRVNITGFSDMLKGISSDFLEQFGAKSISLELKGSASGIINIQGIERQLVDNWSHFPTTDNGRFRFHLLSLNALSEKFTISLNSRSTSISFKQSYNEGVLVNGDSFNAELSYDSMIIEFTLDKTIWNNFNWNVDFIQDEIRELAYLHGNVKFMVKHHVESELSNAIYCYKNGLFDRILNEKLKGLGASYFDSHIIEKVGDIQLEIAFAFRDLSVDQPFFKSYCNDYFTPEDGSHADGLLKGLTYGVMKHFQKHDLTQKYKISEKGMAENLIAAINIRMENPQYSGCVKNKLASPEVVELISDIVSAKLFSKIEKDEQSTQKLIRKFEM